MIGCGGGGGGAHAIPSGANCPRNTYALFTGRATLARYPNANPERDLFPIGYITAKTRWAPPEYDGKECVPKDQCGKSTTVTHTVPETEWHGAFDPLYSDYSTPIFCFMGCVRFPVVFFRTHTVKYWECCPS